MIKQHVFIFIFLMSSIFGICGQNDPMTVKLSTETMAKERSKFEELLKLESPTGYFSAVTVMTRNIYVGTDVDKILEAQNPNDIPALVTQAFQMLLSTNIYERAKCLAREIAITRPHLIGLQEVTTIRIQSPGDFLIGNPNMAEDVLYDFLEILIDALKSRGLNYKVAGKVQNADIELPMIANINPLQFDDVRLTDFDVILARHDVRTSNVNAKNYNVALVIDSMGITIPRGYVTVDAKIKNKTYRFANTHLEPVTIPDLLPIQLAQAQELIDMLDNETLPVILVGDFNSIAPIGETYQLLLASGYTDIWKINLLPFNPDGFTYGHDLTLLNPTPNFHKRIDYIFIKKNSGLFDIGSVFALIVGKNRFNRTPSGLWPSDHGGVVARMRFFKW